MGGWETYPKNHHENSMKLRESQLSHHLKLTQTMLSRGGFFDGGVGGFNPPCFLLESNFAFKSARLLQSKL